MLTSHAENSNPKEMGMHVRLYQAYSGRCHCGKIAFEIESNFPELTTCDCSICRRKNALMVKVHERRFDCCRTGLIWSSTVFTLERPGIFLRSMRIYPFHRKRVTPDFFGINVFLPRRLRSHWHSCTRNTDKGMS